VNLGLFRAASLRVNPACGFYRTGLSGDLCRVRDGAALAENGQYHFGFLHFAYLMVLNRPVTCAPSPCGPAFPVSRLSGSLRR